MCVCLVHDNIMVFMHHHPTCVVTSILFLDDCGRCCSRIPGCFSCTFNPFTKPLTIRPKPLRRSIGPRTCPRIVANRRKWNRRGFLIDMFFKYIYTLFSLHILGVYILGPTCSSHYSAELGGGSALKSDRLVRCVKTWRTIAEGAGMAPGNSANCSGSGFPDMAVVVLVLSTAVAVSRIQTYRNRKASDHFIDEMNFVIAVLYYSKFALIRP